MDVLSKSPWPGNIRELENVIERAVILTMSPYISEKDLPPSLMNAYRQDNGGMAPSGLSLGGMSLEEIESRAIAETLKQTDGNKTEAAKVLEITRTTLNNKLKKYDMLNGSRFENG